MKKSVVILIAVIYIASIALVTFFGLKHNTFFEDKKVSEVHITNENVNYDMYGKKYIVIFPDENGVISYQITYEVTPDDATNKEVDFVKDEQNTAATVDENGLVTFGEITTPRSVIVHVVAADGSNARDSIEITAFPFNPKQ